jgi:hypothetical protein
VRGFKKITPVPYCSHKGALSFENALQAFYEDRVIVGDERRRSRHNNAPPH